jgi:hypothetical protein
MGCIFCSVGSHLQLLVLHVTRFSVVSCLHSISYVILVCLFLTVISKQVIVSFPSYSMSMLHNFLKPRVLLKLFSDNWLRQLSVGHYFVGKPWLVVSAVGKHNLHGKNELYSAKKFFHLFALLMGLSVLTLPEINLLFYLIRTRKRKKKKSGNFT